MAGTAKTFAEMYSPPDPAGPLKMEDAVATHSKFGVPAAVRYSIPYVDEVMGVPVAAALPPGAQGQLVGFGPGGEPLAVNAAGGVPDLMVEDIKAVSTDGGTFTSGAYRTRDLNIEHRNVLAGGGLIFELPYDAQTSNFTVGATLTGGTSGATAIIVADADGGATGTLKVIKITDTFADNETITDDVTGSATSNIPSGVVAANQIYLPSGTYYAVGSAPAYRVGEHKAKLQNITLASTIFTATDEWTDPGIIAQSRSVFSKIFVLGASAIIEIQHRSGLTRATDGFGRANFFGETPIYTIASFLKIA